MNTSPRKNPENPSTPAIPASTERLLTDEGLTKGYNFRPQWEVTPRQVQAMRQKDEAFILVDCRTPGEYEIAHIQGSELVPLKEMAERADHLEEWSDRKLVIVCHHGMRSLQMTHMLREQGFGDVWSMAGGIDLWARDIEPEMKRY